MCVSFSQGYKTGVGKCFAQMPRNLMQSFTTKVTAHKHNDLFAREHNAHGCCVGVSGA